MRIFPSENEKNITLLIFSFIIGITIGLLINFSGDATEIILSAFTTLGAAFFGARYAFTLQNEHQEVERNKENIASANKIIFSLINTYNKVCNFRDQFISDQRENQYNYLFILPAIGMAIPEDLDFDSLSFLLAHEKRNILGELSLHQSGILSMLEVIKLRSELHENIQNKLDEAGIVQGQELELAKIREIIGARNFMMIQIMTTQMIESVDSVIADTEALIEKLSTIMSSIFPGHAIVKMHKLNNAVSIGNG